MAALSRSVWVVDDSATDAAFAKSALDVRYDVAVFLDGAQVLEALADRPPPDVLVLDWIMPGVSGLDVCRFLRASGGAHAQVAILLATAHRATEQVVEGLAAGANDYLVKPYAPEELRARVAALVRGKELLERVRRAEDTVARLMKLTPDPIVVVDAHGRLTYANPEAERIFGQSAVALIGRPIAEVVPDLDLTAIRDSRSRVVPLLDVRIGEDTYSPTARMLPDDFEASATISLRNVTERRRLEARRLDFYSIVAHDLRSPLGSVLLRTEHILRGGRGLVSAELVADMRKIEANVRSMVSLINDFLDLAQLEGGGYQLAREDLDPVELVRSAVDDIRPAVEASGLQIVLDLPATSPRIRADRRRMVQVLTNLLSNAVKFTDPGGRIAVSAAPRGGDLEIAVADTGRGIPAEMVSKLFQRYTRASSDRAGTGLGLMIVREIVEAHGGSASVESQLGAGSTFRVRIPTSAAALSQAQVLIVDDDADIRDTLQLLLEAEGYTVTIAEDGKKALDVMRAGDVPRAILLDMSMPVMNGPELLAHLGRDAELNRIPVLAMSGDLTILPLAPPGVMVLQKPIQVDRVLDFVARHVRGEARPRG
jgi:two-component system phosphate regulon sensor histidine kinase PhoR